MIPRSFLLILLYLLVLINARQCAILLKYLLFLAKTKLELLILLSNPSKFFIKTSFILQLIREFVHVQKSEYLHYPIKIQQYHLNRDFP